MPLTRLSRAITRGRSEQAWRRSRLAVANLSARIDELGISCAKVERSSLLLAGNDLGAGGLRREAEARRAAGLYTEYLTRARLRERFGELVPAKAHAVISTWAIATRAQPRALWPEEALIWESSDPYLYLRTIADGRIICGGEDEDFADEDARDARIPTKDGAPLGEARATLPVGRPAA